MKFKQYIKKIQEETTSGDIASVDSKLGTTPARRDPTELKHLHKGKKCKEHKLLNCEDCMNEHYND